MKTKSMDDSYTTETTTGSVTAEVVHCVKLNVRKSPHPKATVIETLPVGTRVVVNLTAQFDKFYEILGPDGKKGYAMKTYLQLLDE